MDQKKCVSTIIITGLYQQQTRSFQVPTKHLKRLKYYIAFFVIAFVLSLGHIYLLSAENKKDKTANLHLNEEVKKLKIQIPAKKDSNNISLYIDGIQNKLKNINSYLKKRGVNTSAANQGGESQETSLTDEEKVRLYDKYLYSLLNQMQAIPIGYPYSNSQASGYGYRTNPFTSEGSEFHAGVDFKGNTGEIVKSTAKGIVVGAGWYRGYGNCVRISHGNNYLTLYGHLSEIKVKVGKKIRAGEMIGKIGSTGRSTGPHLHYEVRLNDKPLDPNLFLKI